MTDSLEGLRQRLTTRWLGRTHEHHATLGSTNDRAAAWSEAGAPHGALVTADAQRAGRGRLGRVWSSPPGSDIYASCVLKPGRVTQIGALGLAVAVGIREGLGALPDGVWLKWPNDVWTRGRKLAGILCETRWRGGEPDIVVGFGINVHRKVFPPELADVATSLACENNRVESRDRVLANVLLALEDALEVFFHGGFAAIRPRYEPYCLGLGQQVRVHDPSGVRVVEAVGLDDDGALLVRAHASAAIERLDAAELTLFRPLGE